MSAKKSAASPASPKRRSPKRKVSARKTLSAPPPGGDTVPPPRPRNRRKAALTATTVPASVPAEVPRGAAAGPTRFFLAREGVSFGPLTEFQLRESVRLGIFERTDLALAEDGQEWLEVSRLLPAIAPGELTLPDPPPAAPASTGKAAARGLPVVPRLSEHQLREHELLFARSPAPSFFAELTRGRLAFAAVPVAVVVCALLAMSAAFKRHEPPARVEGPARFSQKSPAVRTLARNDAVLTPVSLSAASRR